MSRRVELARARRVRRRARQRRECGNSSTPDGARKHLKPKTPRRRAARRAARGCRARPAPESDVDAALAAAAAASSASAAGVDRGRDAVERHVDDRRHAAGRGRARRGGEALPLGAPGFVDVHVGVDEARDQALAAVERDPRPRGQCGAERLDRRDHAVADPDRRGPPRLGDECGVGVDDEVEMIVKLQSRFLRREHNSAPFPARCGRHDDLRARRRIDGSKGADRARAVGGDQRATRARRAVRARDGHGGDRFRPAGPRRLDDRRCRRAGHRQRLGRMRRGEPSTNSASACSPDRGSSTAVSASTTRARSRSGSVAAARSTCSSSPRTRRS